MNIYWKLAIIALIFCSGMMTEYKFHLANEALGLKKQVVKAQKGETEIIKFNQQFNTIHENDPCLNATVPDSYIKLLK